MIIQTQTTSFKKELFQAIQNLATDNLFIALYTGNANLDADTTAYITTNEVVGTGYTAGGKQLTGVTINTENNAVYINFNNVTWDPAAFTVRGALIYNSSKANRSIAVLNFGSDKTCTNTFTITMPSNTVSTALIRYA
jgi:hypothetical protein